MPGIRCEFCGTSRKVDMRRLTDHGGNGALRGLLLPVQTMYISKFVNGGPYIELYVMIT